jgi:hypothetical protein
MKLISSIVVCKGFALCRGHITSNDWFEFGPLESSTDTKYSQIFTLLEGGGRLFDSANNELGESNTTGTWDLRTLYGKSYKFVAGPHGATWSCINPIPADKFFDFEVKKEGEFVYEGNDKEQIIFCLRGNITVNDKSLEQFKYVRVLNGKTANLTIPKDSEALYMTR